MNFFSEVIPARTLSPIYILFDSIFLLFFLGLLIWKKRYLTVLFAISGGILYFLVDYGIFYGLLRTRVVTGADPAAFLFWLSMSYGITNFAWIWLCLNRDRHIKEWLFLIVSWWFVCPLLAQTFAPNDQLISISRGTSSYHGYMAILLFVGYTGLILYNLKRNKAGYLLLFLNVIGISVQFAWEAALLITGIRNPGFGPLIINSLLETNMGMPYIFLIYIAITRHFHENGKRKKKISTTQEQMAA